MNSDPFVFGILELLAERDRVGQGEKFSKTILFGNNLSFYA